ncbi:MAG: SUMF1/EgtB/PvdO family nonheme iron enzyme [Candidatus Brocadiae bacterium]|nr:SUMF1/EgtB/PvdO family nonheme iron enzyme [Candidatus Brocadiia bacterium]
MKKVILYIIFYFIVMEISQSQEKIITSMVYDLLKINGNIDQTTYQNSFDEILAKTVDKKYPIKKWEHIIDPKEGNINQEYKKYSIKKWEHIIDPKEGNISQESIYKWLLENEKNILSNSISEMIIPIAFCIEKENSIQYYYSLLELSLKPQKRIKKLLNIQKEKEGKEINEVMKNLIETGFDELQKIEDIEENKDRKKLMILGSSKQDESISNFMFLNYLIQYFLQKEEYNLILLGEGSGIAQAEEVLSWNISHGVGKEYVLDILLKDKNNIKPITLNIEKPEEILFKSRAIVDYLYYEKVLKGLEIDKENKEKIYEEIKSKKLHGESFGIILSSVKDEDIDWQKQLSLLIMAILYDNPMSIEELYEKAREEGEEGIWKDLEKKEKGICVLKGIQELGVWMGKNLDIYDSIKQYYKKLSPGIKYLMLNEIVKNNLGKSYLVWEKIGKNWESEEEKRLLACMLWEDKDAHCRKALLTDLKHHIINWPIYEKALGIESLKEIAKEKIANLEEEKTIPLLLNLWKKRTDLEDDVTDILSKTKQIPNKACNYILDKYENLQEKNHPKAIEMLKRISPHYTFKPIFKNLQINHEKANYKSLKEAFFAMKYPENNLEIPSFEYPSPEDYEDLEKGEKWDINGTEVYIILALSQKMEEKIIEKEKKEKEKKIEKNIWLQQDSLVYAWYAMEGNNFDGPKGWLEKDWNESWNGKYVDFTIKTWNQKGLQEQFNLSKSYQKWYAKQNQLKMEKIVVKNKIGYIFMLIPPGKFWMGINGRFQDKNKYEVMIKNPYYIGKYEITQEQWKSVMERNPSKFQNLSDKAPVDTISWHDCQSFCKKIELRLPTEEEWEYACRAATTTKFNLGKNITSKNVNYLGLGKNEGEEKKYRMTTLPVGQLENKNAWGCFDFHGNVWEWCQSVYKENSQKKTQQNTSYVLRGGSWGNLKASCESSYRYRDMAETRKEYFGCRCVLEIKK